MKQWRHLLDGIFNRLGFSYATDELINYKEMKQLTSTRLSEAAFNNWLSGNADGIQDLIANKIDHVSWDEYPHKPAVSFYIGHTGTSICLRFVVEEEERRVTVTSINGAVWEDSCVEFFISFDDAGYYNLEFNAEGVALVGFGKNKEERVLLAENIIKKIQTKSIHNKEENGELIHWELAIIIPIEVFVKNTLSAFNQLSSRANFYKCGDKLQKPHFLAWAPIIYPAPNFHLPAFFGTLDFA